jgi:hypothetical protein
MSILVVFLRETKALGANRSTLEWGVDTQGSLLRAPQGIVAETSAAQPGTRRVLHGSALVTSHRISVAWLLLRTVGSEFIGTLTYRRADFLFLCKERFSDSGGFPIAVAALCVPSPALALEVM